MYYQDLYYNISIHISKTENAIEIVFSIRPMKHKHDTKHIKKHS